MSIDRSNLLGTGAMFWANNTVKFSGAPAFSDLAGPFNILRSNVKFESTATTTVKFANFAIDINNTLSNPTSGSFEAGEFGINFRPNIGTNVTGTTMCGMIVNETVVDASSTLQHELGFHCREMTEGSISNVGFFYGANKPTNGVDYAFCSVSSHPVQFGGGQINHQVRLQNASSGSTARYFATLDDYFILMDGTQTQVTIPLYTTVPLGTTFQVINNTGSTKTIDTPGGAFSGISNGMSSATARTFVASNNGWWVGY